MKIRLAVAWICVVSCGLAGTAFFVGQEPLAELALAAGPAEVITPDLIHQRAMAFFDRVDVNKDGKIDLNDWKEFESREFDAVDKNHDGILNKEDFPRGDSPAASAADHTLTKEQALEASLDEFKVIDTDGDGVLSRDEVLAYTAKIKP